MVVVSEPEAVELVVLPTTVVDVVVEVDDVVVVLVDELVVVLGTVVVVVAGGLLKTLMIEGLPSFTCPPNRSANGRPAINSTVVTKASDNTKITAAVPAMAGHRMPLDFPAGDVMADDVVAAADPAADPAAAIGNVAVTGSSVAPGEGDVAGVSVVANSSGRAIWAVASVVSVGGVSSTAAAFVVSSASGESGSALWSAEPAAPVPPNRRNSVARSGTCTTTCCTA